MRLLMLKKCLLNPIQGWNLVKTIILKKKVKTNIYPFSADIEPTLLCNLNCVMCHRKELDKKREKKSMTIEEFKIAIDKIPTLLRINLQGMGEPLISKGFFEMVRYAKKKGLIVTTVTNGVLLNDKKAQELIESGLDIVNFSIENTDPAAYEKYRRNSNLKLVLKNLKNLAERKKKARNKSLSIRIWMLLFENNIDQLLPMIELSHEYGVDKLGVQTELTWRGKPNWKDKIEKIKAKKDEQFLAEIDKAQKRADELGVDLFIYKGTGSMKSSYEDLCLWPWKAIYITSAGDITPCCIIADPEVCYLGNILEQDFEDIWNGEKYQRLRKSLLEGKEPNYCGGCYGK